MKDVLEVTDWSKWSFMSKTDRNRFSRWKSSKIKFGIRKLQKLIKTEFNANNNLSKGSLSAQIDTLTWDSFNLWIIFTSSSRSDQLRLLIAITSLSGKLPRFNPISACQEDYLLFFFALSSSNWPQRITTVAAFRHPDTSDPTQFQDR